MPLPVPSLKTTAPRSVLVAGVIVALQGLTGIGFGLAVLVHALTGATISASSELGEFGYYVALGACVAAVAVALLLGKRWSRTPAAMIQVLLLLVDWQVIANSGQIVFGILIGVACLAALVLLFTAPARVWAARQY